MTDGVNSKGTNDLYYYKNTELSKYDTDNDGSLSIFEMTNIEDEEDLEILAGELELLSAEDIEEADVDTEAQISDLESKLEDAKENQGIIGKAWNGIKNFTSLGSSTNKCEQAIEDFKNGEITYEEADSIISNFSSKQESSVNLAANIATGVASTLIVGSAVMTGGLSLGVIAAAAGVGAATKAGLKFIDRATNEVKGDAVDAKQIAKDSLSGAVDGAISVATMGMGTAAVTSKTVAEQTLKQTVIEGAKAGAKAGAISGAVTGASDYSIEAALEEDVEFNVGDLAKTTVETAIGGAVAGGVMGGISSGIQYNKVSSSTSAATGQNIDTPENIETLKASDVDSTPEALPVQADEASANIKATDNVESTTISTEEAELPVVQTSQKTTGTELPDNIEKELKQQAEDLSKVFNSNIDEAKSQIQSEFGDLSTVEQSNITGRAKSEKSIFEKLAKKFNKGKLTSTSTEACSDAIGDAYGTRIQINNLSAEKSQEIIEDCLSGTNISYEQFVQYMNGDTSTLDDAGIAALNDMKSTIIDLLKEEQTQEVVDQLVDAIGSGRLTITELNNYGDDISSYFTNYQLQEIADAYYIQTGEKLTIVSADDFTSGSGTKFDLNSTSDYTISLDTDGAIKDSGYASSQMNTKQTFSNGTVGNGELQIRGTALNEFADAEHIPYDIRTGKITAGDSKYSDVFDIIDNMTDTVYDKYNQFLTDTYQYLRLKELGITTEQPNITEALKNSGLSEEALNLLSMDGLITVSQRGH